MTISNTDPISMATIDGEVASVSSRNLRVLSTNAIAYNNGQGNGVTNSPYQMKEFLGYTHTQNFGTPSYVRYYLGSSNSDPYAAFQTTISASTNDITSQVIDTANNVGSYGTITATYSTTDIRVLRNSSYYYVAIKLDGIGSSTSRYFYRESNQAQGPFSATFVDIMRITPSINPGGIQVGITLGNTTTTTSSTGAYGTVGSAAIDGDTTSGGNFSTYGLNDFQYLTTNNSSVGARWKVSATAEALSGGSSSVATRDSTAIFNITIKKPNY